MSSKIPVASRAPATRVTAILTATENVQSQEPPLQLQDMQGIHPTLPIYRSSSRLPHATPTSIKHPYLRNMEFRGGGYAILRARWDIRF